MSVSTRSLGPEGLTGSALGPACWGMSVIYGPTGESDSPCAGTRGGSGSMRSADRVQTRDVRGDEMLKSGRVATRLPARDLERARAFYSEKLGLEPAETREGGLRYVFEGGEFALFASAGSPAGDHTQMGWEVDDIRATVRALAARGVVFEEYDLPGLRTVDGIAEIEGNYPSKGTAELGAWFYDSEGNLLAIGQPLGG
jgi:catechol 2,3-dioxygenase-like lactoylglutathione lyase family enzyme